MSKPVPQFLVAADTIIEIDNKIVLIERKNYPFGWALPGGIVELGETVEQAAIREAEEETCLKICLTGLVGVYSKPNRDPRGPVISVAFRAIPIGGVLRAADDAKNIQLFHPSGLFDLAFDHQQIINDYLMMDWPNPTNE